MSPTLRIAAAQSTITTDIRANGAHIRDLMMQAHRDDVRLIQFPEGALSGYVKSQIRNWDDVDWRCLQEELEAIADLAGHLGLWTIIGCNHALTPPNRPHNSLYVIAAGGTVVSRYDKRYCSHAELSGWYTPGTQPCVFEVDGFRFGCALCIEIQFMDVFADYERQDVDCVLFSAYAKDSMFWTMAQAYASANNYWMSVSTPAGCSTGLASGLLGPDGSVIARAKADGHSDLAVAILDRASPTFDVALNKARPWRRQARAGEIYRDRQVEDPRSDNRLSF